jgi:hypothetical protein
MHNFLNQGDFMSNDLSAPAHVTGAIADVHRQAYNAAFDELGLPWHWDAATYERLIGHASGGVRRYLETESPHLLRAYEPEFLVAAVEAVKARRLCGVHP